MAPPSGVDYVESQRVGVQAARGTSQFRQSKSLLRTADSATLFCKEGAWTYHHLAVDFHYFVSREDLAAVLERGLEWGRKTGQG